MANPDNERLGRRLFSQYSATIVLVSLAALCATFLLADSSYQEAVKTRGFSGIIAGFLIVCVCLYLRQSRRGPVDKVDAVDKADETERCLLMLDEANQFFAGALRSADIFRLVSSRMRDLIPFQTTVLHLLDESRTQLRVVEAEGPGADRQRARSVDMNDNLAGKCYLSQRVETDDGLSIAIPLSRGTEVFGVLELFFETNSDLASVDVALLEAVGTRVAPLVLSALAFERSQANALTDVTTDLPNERAFYLVLENQINEAQRNPERRPVIVLAVDIKNFDDVNQRFGHAAGDRVLNFAAQIIKDNLRQMDFLARSADDQFLASLPTASSDVSREVMARIETGFQRKLQITESDSIEIELNFGWAAFGEDGETSDQLLRAARMRKDQSKSARSPKVLWFSKEPADQTSSHASHPPK